MRKSSRFVCTAAAAPLKPLRPPISIASRLPKIVLSATMAQFEVHQYFGQCDDGQWLRSRHLGHLVVSSLHRVPFGNLQLQCPSSRCHCTMKLTHAKAHLTEKKPSPIACNQTETRNILSCHLWRNADYFEGECSQPLSTDHVTNMRNIRLSISKALYFVIIEIRSFMRSRFSSI